MKEPLKQKQFLKSGEKREERVKSQARALRENLRRRKKPKPQEKKDR
jgi:hypothetical protein